MATNYIEEINSIPISAPVSAGNKKRKRGRPRKMATSGAMDTDLSIKDISSSSPMLGNNGATAKGISASEIEQRKRGRAQHTLPQAHLPTNVKHRIVELFACFHTHSQVHDIILAEYNRDLTKGVLAMYDPQRANCQIGKRLVEYYQQVRERYIADAKGVAIAHQAHRLRRLEDISDKALAAHDFGNAIKALEVAAKEMGGLMNSTVEVKHSGTVGHVHATVAEARAELAMRLNGLAERMGMLPSPQDYQCEEGEMGVVEGDIAE